MDETKRQEEPLNVDFVLNIAEQSLLCCTVVDVLNTHEKACIRKVMPQTTKTCEHALRSGYDKTCFIKVYVEDDDHTTEFTSMLGAAKTAYEEANIPVPSQGMHVKREANTDVFNDLALYIMDGANRTAVCKKLYFRHREKYPGEEYESERAKWRFISAKMYKSSVKPMLALIAKATNLRGQQTSVDDNFAKLVYYKRLCDVSDVIVERHTTIRSPFLVFTTGLLRMERCPT
jgi:hypothetical protein